jgi:hypothetical protein
VCYDCGVPEATGFACRTGDDGPRGMLIAVEPIGGDATDPSRRRWAYVGPPGDPRRVGVAGPLGGGPEAPTKDPTAPTG